MVLVYFIPKLLFTHLEAYIVKAGNDLCTNGERTIDTLTECKLAIRYLNLVFEGVESVGDYPKGCYNWHGSNLAYWNSVTAGRANTYGQPVCKKGEIF